MKSTLLCVFNFSRERNESETFKMVTDLERHAKRLIEANTKERIENEKKITYALSHQVDQLNQEVGKEGVVINLFNI